MSASIKVYSRILHVWFSVAVQSKINESVCTLRGLYDSISYHAGSGRDSLILYGACYWTEDETGLHWRLDYHQPLPGRSG